MTRLAHINPWGKHDITLAHLRRAWRDLRGREAPARLALSDLAFERRVRTLGCSACDDDRHWVYLVRGERLASSTVIEERNSDWSAAQQLAGLGLQPGDVLVSHHDHACAADCSGEDAAFLRAYRLTA